MDESTQISHSCQLIAIYLFYNIANGKQAKLAFSKKFRHCNTIVFDGKYYILVEFDQKGIQLRVIKATSLVSLLRGLKIMVELKAIVCAEVYDRKKTLWKPWWVRSCNELSRYVTGVDVGFSFNPAHLYNLLIRYDNKRNFKILEAWRR